ncbi:efflux RND transporter periplasmic adaptor subunit [Nonomuraea sp. NPDC050556]|uniref:efflux RND transporter periplasmic adaptor subunit n=1 Tax=Nonomuraea sp. NPDC050556 TaxID=3364369 RepID=UPI0037AF0E02
MKKALITNGVLGILLLGGAGLAYTQLGAGRAAGETAVRTVAATRGTVVASVSASGSVASAKARSLSFAASGTVEKIYVKAGDKVAKGQLLARLDDDAARESLAAAESTYDEAVEAGTSTTALYASYVKARNAYRQAERVVAGTVLKAPFAATVTAVNGTVGGSSSVQGTGQNAPAGFVQLADTGKLQLVGNFTESDVAKLKLGQEASVTFDALPGTQATGKITQIEPVAATSDNVVQYPVTVTFTKVPKQVRLGQTATVQVEVGRAENAVSVPTTAISTAGGQSTVTLLKNGVQTRTVVELGVQGTATTEIKSGVQEGDQVVPPAVTTTTTGGSQRQGGFGGGFPGGGGNPVPGGGR